MDVSCFRLYQGVGLGDETTAIMMESGPEPSRDPVLFNQTLRVQST